MANTKRNAAGRWSGPDGEHGLSKIPEYRVWVLMIQRCHTPGSKSFKDYGGRGIVVCDRWRYSFKNFITDMGRRPSAGHSIERIKNGRGYEPGNCKWATRAEQGRNQRSNHLLTFRGETKVIADWAIETGLLSATISYRVLKLGWTPERALTTPLLRKHARKATS
jgi:hypothetical protein